MCAKACLPVSPRARSGGTRGHCSPGIEALPQGRRCAAQMVRGGEPLDSPRNRQVDLAGSRVWKRAPGERSRDSRTHACGDGRRARLPPVLQLAFAREPRALARLERYVSLTAPQSLVWHFFYYRTPEARPAASIKSFKTLPRSRSVSSKTNGQRRIAVPAPRHLMPRQLRMYLRG